MKNNCEYVFYFLSYRFSVCKNDTCISFNNATLVYDLITSLINFNYFCKHQSHDFHYFSLILKFNNNYNSYDFKKAYSRV